jgi:RNA polymerase sigma-70 factor (ECF subfamily)
VAKRQEDFERIAMPHSRSLLRVAQRLTSGRATSPALAEDLVQETLLLAWRAFDQFQRGTNVRAWLFRILLNVFYAQGRKVRSAPVIISLDAFEGLERGLENMPRETSSPFSSAEVIRALDKLSAEHRTVLLLGVAEGFTCQEMAGILSLPIGTVMSRISRARQALRELLEPAPASNESTTRKTTHAIKEVS